MTRCFALAGAAIALWPGLSIAQVDSGADATPEAAPAAPAQASAGPEAVATAKGAAASEAAQRAVDDWDQKVADFDKLNTPDSPAAAFLGVSSTEIQRPGTPNQAAVTLGAFLSDGFTFPKSLAVELSPYWLVSHPYLTSHAYQEGGARNIYRTLTLSIASKQTERQSVDATGAATKVTDSDLAIGLRMRLIGFSPEQSDKCTQQVLALQRDAQDLAMIVLVPQTELDQLAKRFTPGSPEFMAAYEALRQQKKAEIEKAKTHLEQTQKKLDKRCFEVAASTQGWSSDFAAAGDFFFAESKATKDAARFNAGAAWLTLAYAGERVSGILLGRYAAQKVADDWQNIADGGLRLILKGKIYALSAEGIARWRVSGPDKGWTYKLDIAAEYEIRDQLWVRVVFGKNYDSSQPGSLFSLANLGYGLGKPTIGSPGTANASSGGGL